MQVEMYAVGRSYFGLQFSSWVSVVVMSGCVVIVIVIIIIIIIIFNAAHSAYIAYSRFQACPGCSRLSAPCIQAGKRSYHATVNQHFWPTWPLRQLLPGTLEPIQAIHEHNIRNAPDGRMTSLLFPWKVAYLHIIRCASATHR